MSLEQAIAANTAAIEALTAALAGAAPAAEKPAKAEKPKVDKPAAAPAAPAAKYDKAAMQAAVNEVKEKLGLADAKALIKEVGKADKMADIVDPALIDAVYEAAKAKLETADEEM